MECLYCLLVSERCSAADIHHASPSTSVIERFDDELRSGAVLSSNSCSLQPSYSCTLHLSGASTRYLKPPRRDGRTELWIILPCWLLPARPVAGDVRLVLCRASNEYWLPASSIPLTSLWRRDVTTERFFCPATRVMGLIACRACGEAHGPNPHPLIFPLSLHLT